MSEVVAELRAEIDRLRADLAAQQRECDILRSVRGMAVVTRVDVAPIRPAHPFHIKLEQTVNALISFARYATTFDCYHDEGDDASCRECYAASVLKDIENWRWGGDPETPMRRFEGAMYARASREDHWPREVKMHRAWSNYMTTRDADSTLAAILDEGGNTPSGRDWYVATSVVQWLATTCGENILRKADYVYTKYDEDFDAFTKREKARSDAAWAMAGKVSTT